MAETGRTGTRGADPISMGMLAEGQRMMTDRLAQALPELLEKMDESLFDLSEQATDGELQRLYLSLQGELRVQRDSIMAAFRPALQAEIAKAAKAEGQADFDTMALSLVEFDDMEESLGVSGLASGLRNACSAELRDLGIRIAHLRGLREPGDKDNPYAPDVLASAFRTVFSPIADIKSRLSLLRLVEKHFHAPLCALYNELNAYLVERGVLPEIKLHARPSSASRQSGGAGQRAAATSESGTAGGSPGGADQPGDPGDLFASLQQLIMMNMGRPTGMGAMAGVAASMPGGVAPVMPPQATDELLKSLTHLQRGDLSGLPVAAEQLGEGFDPAQFALGTANLLRNLRDAGLYNAASQVDAITIDVVAMLFDFVFDDKDIPAAVRVLIGRLQIPVLKAAMLDKKFFSKKDNPARKLLDRLAQVSVAWSGEVSEDDPLYQRLAAVVHDVIDNFEEDGSVFERAVDQLDQYIAEEQKHAEERSKTTADALYKRELKEFAQILAQEEMVRRVQDAPEEIQRFLLNYWVDELAAAYENGGEDGDAWKNALAAVDDLIWSIAPKKRQEDRLRLVRTLPQLLKRIESVMRHKAAAEEEIKEFSARLVELHITALKGVQQPQEITSDTQPQALMPEQSAAAEPSAAIFVSPPALVVSEESREAPPAPSQPAPSQPVPATCADTGSLKWTLSTKNLTPEDDFDRMAKQMKKGAWVEFVLDDGVRLRVKLTWMSPMKGVMLFTERDGSNAVKISPRSLANRFRAGSAAVLGDASLVERAVSNVMDQLKKGTSPEALPAVG